RIPVGDREVVDGEAAEHESEAPEVGAEELGIPLAAVLPESVAVPAREGGEEDGVEAEAEPVADEPAPASERDEDSEREAHTSIPFGENVAPMREAAAAEANALTTVVWGPIATEREVGETIPMPPVAMHETSADITGESASVTVEEPA